MKRKRKKRTITDETRQAYRDGGRRGGFVRASRMTIAQRQESARAAGIASGKIRLAIALAKITCK